MPYVAKKRFGQNFLTDQTIIQQIITAINPLASQYLVEIGPGLGALTLALEQILPHLDVIELDNDIVKILRQQVHPKITIHHADALKFDYATFPTTIRIVGNLPYNISTPLLFYLMQFTNIDDMHFMLQQEVVDRICATPHNRDYGRLSIMLQYRFDCYKIFTVPPTAFHPMPKVYSAMVCLKPKPKELWQHINVVKLNHIVTKAFGQRRKIISNSLRGIVPDELLTQLGNMKRAENITVAEYMQLATF